MRIGRNHEGFPDPTASTAIYHIMKEGKKLRVNWFDKKNDPLSIILRIQKERGITKKDAEKIVRDQMPTEPKYQGKIRDAIREAFPEAYIVKIQQAQYSTGGIPDLMVIINGHYFGFEVKRPYFNKKGELQKKAIKEITEAGGTAEFVSYPEEAIKIINTYLKTQGGQDNGRTRIIQ